MIATTGDQVLLRLIYEIASRTGGNSAEIDAVAEIIFRAQQSDDQHFDMYFVVKTAGGGYKIVDSDFEHDLGILQTYTFTTISVNRQSLVLTSIGKFTAEIFELPTQIQFHLDAYFADQRLVTLAKCFVEAVQSGKETYY